MTSRIAKPGQTDQRKVYLNWANHHLRKLGEDGAPLSDLKEIGDGLALPRVLRAVVQEAVPGIHLAVDTDDQRRENIEKCIEFLDKFGVNCAAFSTKDLCDAKDRAVLSLFYSLSQYKRTPSTTSGSTPSKIGPAPSKGGPPSRIARPVSPGLKASHGVTVNGRVATPISPNPAHPKENSLSVASTHSTSPPATSPLTSPLASAPAQKVLGPRRTAGSSIMTSTTFDRPYKRKPPQKNTSEGEDKAPQVEGDKTPEGEGDKKEEKQNGELNASNDSYFASAPEVKSDPESDNTTEQQRPKGAKVSKLAKHSSFSFGHSHQTGQSRLHKPAASKGTTTAEEAESATPPSTSKLKSLLGGKLHAPGHKHKEAPPQASSSASSGDAPEDAGTNDQPDPGSRPSSRLKFLGSGRSTPSNSNRSGIQRPSSRLSKSGSSSTSNLTREGVGEGEEPKQLRLQRKGSDGAVKRHLVNPVSKNMLMGHSLQAGNASSLPRHLPKGTLQHHGSTDSTEPSELSSSSEAEKPTEKAADKPAHRDMPPTKGEGLGLRRPAGGLKKPGTSLLSGVRTPNLPSSGPQSSNTATEGKDRSVGGGADNSQPPSVENSPSLGKKLMAPKAAGANKLQFGLKRPTSPSSRMKLHKVAPATSELSASPPKEGKVAGPLPPREAELCSSSSSLESCEVKDKSPPPPPQVALEGVKFTGTGGVQSSAGVKGQIASPEKDSEVEKPMQLNMSKAESANEDVVTPPAEFKDEDPKDSHLRFGRRISPEGMSHEDVASSRVEGGSKITPPQSPKEQHSSSEDIESATSTEKEGNKDSHHSRVLTAEDELPSKTQRARSLSPKSSHRLVPKSMSRVRDLEGVGALIRVNSSDSTNSSGEGTPSLSRKPVLKSSMRKRSGSKSRHSSSSSMEGVTSPVPRHPKVTISPRSSQVVYDPEETGLSRAPGNQPLFSTKFLVPGGAVSGSDRPSSFASLDSSTTSESLSPSSSSHTLFPRGGGVARHASVRSTMSEQLDYRNEHLFLNAGMNAGPPDVVGSTPELIESFENQLTNMKAELSDKDRMLSMYENSMADLSTKMHMLKKSLEEKDNAIRHLTEKQTWYDLESHSLMTSRAASVAADHEALSDGYLSDSAMEDTKDKNKKKKAWKFSFRHKKKDASGMEHLSPNADTESVISSRTAKSLKRSFGKKKAPDLMSISEYPTEARYKDIDTKSTFTVDLRSEYGGGGGGLLPLWEEDMVKVYDDPEPGARAEIILFIDTNETTTKSPANDSGYYGDLLSRQNSGGKPWNRDSVASSDSGNHGDDSTEQFILGTLSISPELSWVGMDTKVAEIFHHHVNNIDTEGSLGINEESVYCYLVGEERRQLGNALLPPITPYQALANKLTIKVHMKGAGQQSCDSLAYKTLMGIESLQSYMGILHETQWLVVMGTKGTCKSSLVSGLAQHLSSCLEAEEGEGMEDLVMGVVGGEIVRFNLDKDGLPTILKYFKNDLAKRVQLQLHPPIVVLEDIYECKDLEQLLVAASALTRRPYIVAALSSGTTKGIPLHQLMFHHQIRVITCNPQTDPVVGILSRSLRKQIYQLKATAQSLDPVAERLVNWVPYLLHHLNSFINKFHSNVVNLGPRVFMSCPLGHSNNELENWFLSLWNHFIIPYLMGTIMAGIETYTADPMLEWVDVREWVVETYPWPSAINVNKLRTLNPEDVGWNHAVRPHQNRYIMVKDDKIADDVRSLAPSVMH